MRAVKYKWEVYVAGVGRGNLQDCDPDLGELEMDVQKGDGMVTIMVGWGSGMFMPGDKNARWIIKPDRKLAPDPQHVLRKIVDIEVEVEDKWELAGAYGGGTASHGQQMQRTHGQAPDSEGSKFKGLWVRDVLLRTGWQGAAEKRERAKMARAEDDKNDLVGGEGGLTDPESMTILKDKEPLISRETKARTDTAIGVLKAEGLVQLIEFPILKALPPTATQLKSLQREFATMPMEKLQKKARAQQASKCDFNKASQMIECKYCVLDAGEQRQALDSDDEEFVKALLYSAAVRYDKISAEEDKYLTEVEIRRWLTVLNYGLNPNDMEIDDIYQKVHKHRSSIGLATGATDDRLLFREDFMLLVFDYYLAMGPEHMRRVFTDLLRT
jgi:hypothetical protein